jgi:hypothetical protein
MDRAPRLLTTLMRKNLWLLVMCCALWRAHGEERFVTIQVGGDFSGGPAETNELAIAVYEVAELVYFPSFGGPVLHILRDGATFTYIPGDFNPVARPVIGGPALLRLRNQVSGNKVICTFKVTPQSFPPDKTIVIPEGTEGATITLECSTNLISWATATNGIYTGTNGAKFFRIRADRIP